jgi:hypothetical protein
LPLPTSALATTSDFVSSHHYCRSVSAGFTRSCSRPTESKQQEDLQLLAPLPFCSQAKPLWRAPMASWVNTNSTAARVARSFIHISLVHHTRHISDNVVRERPPSVGRLVATVLCSASSTWLSASARTLPSAVVDQHQFPARQEESHSTAARSFVHVSQV